MSIFDAYDEEFRALSEDINKNLNELKDRSSDTSKSSSIIRLVDGLLRQCSDLIQQMVVEIRSHDPSARVSLNEKVSNYKKSLSSMKSEFERMKEQSSRSELIGEKSASERQRLLNANDKLSRQNDMIANAHRAVLDTEDVANEITIELARNRETIESTRSKTSEFTALTDSARRIVAAMSRRDVRQKYMVIFIALLLIIAIVLIVYYTSK